MNCRQFQEQVFEHLDGEISPDARTKAEGHLAQCGACREVLRRQRAVAQGFSERFHRDAAAITLRPGAEERILAAMENRVRGKEERRRSPSLWVRLGWIGGLAACVVLGVWMAGLNGRPSPRKFVQAPKETRATVSVDMAFGVPTWVSRQEGNEALDTLVFEPRMASQTIHLGQD